MIFNIITIFPSIFDSYFNESILKRAQEKKLIKIKTHDLRKYTKDKRKTVDDAPYGGGAGMVMKIEPLFKALKVLKKQETRNKKQKVILLSAKGKTWSQQMAKKYSKLDELTFVCGRYEGVDERILNFVDEEISVGDYVLTGGELPAMIIIDSITRLIPGVLGNIKSIEEESFSDITDNCKLKIENCLEYPQYTRPEIFEANGKKYKVPDILLSGDHAKIEKWKREKSKKKRCETTSSK